MITVLFATHNGEKVLPMMLDAFCYLAIPNEGWEIIAVDNASNDKSADIIKSYIEKLPITYLYEAKSGKNNALNLGIPTAQGELIIFTDDDIIPHNDWLIQWSICAKNHLDFSIFGGTIQPKWLVNPAQWILDNTPLGITYAITPEEMKEGETSPYSIWGPNMAIRKAIFDSGFRFNSSIGPNGENYVMGSETEFTVRLYDAGYKPWFCKNTIVQHIIRDYQITPDWIIKRAYRYGRSLYLDDHEEFTEDLSLIYGIPRWKFRIFLSHYINNALAYLLFNKNKKFKYAWEISCLRGYISEAINQLKIQTNTY